MAVRKILRYPHPALKRLSRAVAADDGELVNRLAEDLVDTMRAHQRCVGVSAPQLGELVRMIVLDVSDHPKATSSHGLLVLANPTVVETRGEEVAREGCLSIPDLTANVRRARCARIEAIEPGGERRTFEVEGFEARCLLHEIDHLDGILFLDRVDSLQTDVFRRKRY